MNSPTSQFFIAGPQIEAHQHGDTWWASCPTCSGFTVTATTWNELYRLVYEFHALPSAKHRSWTMINRPDLIYCSHGLDMRLHPRCFLCTPLEPTGYVAGCQCPTSWNGIMRPPCPTHNPSLPDYTLSIRPPSGP